MLNDPVNWVDPEGLQATTLPGPIPFPIVLPSTPDPKLTDAYRRAWQDISDGLDWLLIDGGIGDELYDLINDPCLSSEHTKDKRKSTKGKHEKGKSRKKTDKWGEKGDARRPYRR